MNSSGAATVEVLAASGLLLFMMLRYRVLIGNLIAYLHWCWRKRRGSASGHIHHDDVVLYYEVHGAGPALILLHGGLTSQLVFFAQLPTLARMYRVIAIDLRGQGRSTIGEAEFSYQLLAGDVLAVLDALQVGRAAFVGWSDGGNIGLTLALQHPQRVASLVTIGANFHPSGLSEASRRSMRKASAMDEGFITRLAYNILSPQPGRRRELWRRINAMWLKGPDLTREDLTRISCPALVIIGERDLVTCEHAVTMATAMQDAQLVIVPRAGHNLLVERPRLLLELITGFVS